jgi:hypothetical protein
VESAAFPCRTGTAARRREQESKILLSLTAASAIVAAASISPASAMTVGTASGIQAAIADTSVLDEVAYVCRHRSAACAGGGRVATIGRGGMPLSLVVSG